MSTNKALIVAQIKDLYLQKADSENVLIFRYNDLDCRVSALADYNGVYNEPAHYESIKEWDLNDNSVDY